MRLSAISSVASFVKRTKWGSSSTWLSWMLRTWRPMRLKMTDGSWIIRLCERFSVWSRCSTFHAAGSALIIFQLRSSVFKFLHARIASGRLVSLLPLKSNSASSSHFRCCQGQ
eukprot:12676_4